MPEGDQKDRQAVVLHGRVTKSRQESAEASFTPAITPSSALRSASRPSPNNAPVIIQFNDPKSATTPYTPQKCQEQIRSVTSSSLPTPPNSGTPTHSRKTLAQSFSNKGISSFRASLATVSQDDNNDGAQITNSQINVRYAAPKHKWTIEERMCLVLLKRFFVADSVDISTLSNFIFPKTLAPFKSNMVDMQYAEIQNGKNCTQDGDCAWDFVWKHTNFTLASREHEDILQKLGEAASEVGVAIHRRLEDTARNLIKAGCRREVLSTRPARRPRVQKSNTTKKRRIQPSQASPDQNLNSILNIRTSNTRHNTSQMKSHDDFSEALRNTLPSMEERIRIGGHFFEHFIIRH